MDITPETRDVLREAKGLVTRGWFGAKHGELFNHVGARPGNCVATAIQRASRNAPMLPALSAICDAIGIGDENGIFEWNDAPERTHEEVVAVFDLALGIKPTPAPFSSIETREEVYV
jgi:hypothetical protein